MCVGVLFLFMVMREPSLVLGDTDTVILFSPFASVWCGRVSQMKTTDNLKSLIGDLKLYEQELQERVRQKETELELLLVQRLAPNGGSFLSSGGRKYQASAPFMWQLRVGHAPEQTETDAAGSPPVSPSLPPITRERRHLRSPALCGHHQKQQQPKKAMHERHLCAQQHNASDSIDMDQLSSIVHVRDESVDSSSLGAVVELLQTGGEMAVSQSARRVHFVSHTSQTASDATPLDRDSETVGSICGMPRPKVQAPPTCNLRGGKAERESPCIVAAPPQVPSSMATDVFTGSTRCIENSLEAPCHVLGKRGRKESVLSVAVENFASEELVLPGELPVCNSAPLSVSGRYKNGRQQLQRKNDAGKLQVQICRGLTTKRTQSSASRSVSAARSHAAIAVVQHEKGEGAGIVIACGPTLFFD